MNEVINMESLWNDYKKNGVKFLKIAGESLFALAPFLTLLIVIMIYNNIIVRVSAVIIFVLWIILYDTLSKRQRK